MTKRAEDYDLRQRNNKKDSMKWKKTQEYNYMNI